MRIESKVDIYFNNKSILNAEILETPSEYNYGLFVVRVIKRKKMKTVFVKNFDYMVYSE